MNIKTTIGIIAIAISSISIAEAGQNRYSERAQHYGSHEQVRHYRQAQYKTNRHHRKHHYYNQHNRHHSQSNRGWRRDHHERRHYRESNYRQQRQHSPRTVVVHADPLLPIIAGGVIAAKIAKKIIQHDPIIRSIIRHDPIARAIFGH